MMEFRSNRITLSSCRKKLHLIGCLLLVGAVCHNLPSIESKSIIPSTTTTTTTTTTNYSSKATRGRISFVNKYSIRQNTASSLSSSNIIKSHVDQIGLDSILRVQRGGYIDEEDEYDVDVDESEDESEDEYDVDESEEEEEEDEYDDESDDEEVEEIEEIDEEEEEDDEEDDESETEESTGLASTSSKGTIVSDYDDPISLSPMIDMGVTLGIMVLCNKLDLTNTKIIRYAR